MYFECFSPMSDTRTYLYVILYLYPICCIIFSSPQMPRQSTVMNNGFDQCLIYYLLFSISHTIILYTYTRNITNCRHKFVLLQITDLLTFSLRIIQCLSINCWITNFRDFRSKSNIFFQTFDKKMVLSFCSSKQKFFI